MSSNSKTSVSKAQNEQHKKVLSQLLKLDCNRRCCDCSARGPTWASVNLGLFVCLNCSGIHRSLGTHLSKVRSTTLDTWLPEQVEFISKLGNAKANLFWEANLPSNITRPAEGDMSGLKNFITSKYQDQAYASRDYDSPPNIDNYFTHPFMRQADSPAAVASPTAEAQASDKASVSSDGTASPIKAANGATSPAPLSRPARVSFKGIAGPAPAGAAATAAAPAATAAAANNLMDLLSLEGDAAPAAEQPQASASNADGDWAAFMDGNVAQPATPTPAAVATVISQDSGWDAFQGADIAVPASASAAASTEGLFDPFGDSQAVQAASVDSKASGGNAAQAASSAPATKHVPKKSADDIMKMFDKPQQGAFGQFPMQMSAFSQSQGAGASQQFSMQQAQMFGLTPQQLMQAQQLYAAQQQMQMAGAGGQQNAFRNLGSQGGGAWGQQQMPSFAPGFQSMPQQNFGAVAGPSGFP